MLFSVHNRETMYNAPILKRALDIMLFIVKERHPLGITEIAARLAINKSTAFGILRALEEQGFIVKDEMTKKYSMGAQLFELSRMVFKRSDIASISRPFLEKLANLAQETVFMGLRDGDRLKVVQVVEARKDLKISSPIGAYHPILAGAAGKACLAAMEDKEIEELVSRKGLRRFTDNSITSKRLFMNQIREIRKTGYAVDLEEFIKGIRAVATLIRLRGEPIAAIWVAGFTNSVDDRKIERIAHHLLLTSHLISARAESQTGPSPMDDLDEMASQLTTENMA
jgi:IclR family transcriptional regulator, KDG regulon repressor